MLYLLASFLRLFEAVFGRWYPILRPEKRDLSQNTVIVTGANVGIGLEVARQLAEMNATVVLACRNKEKAEAARVDILTNGKIDAGKVQVLILDCADLKSVERFAKEWGTRRLDILINNAGMTNGTYEKNPQGFELTYATNILSHFLLTNLLLPNINKYGRIVNMSSILHYNVQEQLDVSDLDNSKMLCDIPLGASFNAATTMDLYTRTKLMQAYFTREMQQRLDQSERFKVLALSIYCCHPGTVRSSIWGRPQSLNSLWKDHILALVDFFGISTEQGACTPVHIAVSPAAFENKGMYWDRMAVRDANRLVEDKETRSKIWGKWIEESGLGEKAVL